MLVAESPGRSVWKRAAAVATAGVAVGGIVLWWRRRSVEARTSKRNDSKRSRQIPTPPEELHRVFDPCDVKSYDPKRFHFVRKIQDASRNRGQVHLMKDGKRDEYVAVKKIPNSWICGNHHEFLQEHPAETELPWQDLGCVKFLESIGYPYVCGLRGVYKDDEHTYFMSTFASGGDLFSLAVDGLNPGQERETLLRPVVCQVIDSIRQLHDASIVHRDISPENIVMQKENENFASEVKIIDFGMASPLRIFRSHSIGKPSYQAPEIHIQSKYDAFLADTFAVGIVIYTLMIKEYPWLSTKPDGCKRFMYAKQHGLRAFMKRQKIRKSNLKVSDVISEDLKVLLEGLLAMDPSQRLSLGEASWPAKRKSVFDTTWVKGSPMAGVPSTSAERLA